MNRTQNREQSQQTIRLQLRHPTHRKGGETLRNPRPPAALGRCCTCPNIGARKPKPPPNTRGNKTPGWARTSPASNSRTRLLGMNTRPHLGKFRGLA